MSAKLFKVEDGLLTIDKEEVRLIPEFKRILIRDRGSEGDADGRKKYMAMKEFIYIFFRADVIMGYDVRYDSKEAHRKAKHDAELPDDWKPDDEVKAAIKRFKEEQTSANVKIFGSLKRGLYATEKVINHITESIENILEDLEANPIDLDDPEEVKRHNQKIDTIHTDLGRLMKYSKELPHTIEEVEKYEKRVINEVENQENIRGGRSLGNREKRG